MSINPDKTCRDDSGIERTDVNQRSVDVSNPVPERSIIAWLGILLILVLLSEEVAYAFNLVTPALPQMAGHFPEQNIGWVSTIFVLSGAITAPIIGKLADRSGKRRWLLIVTLCMAAGSLLVALSPSFSIVLLGRAIEGVGLSIIPITYSLMRDIFPDRLRAMAVSVATAGVGLTSITGPIIAGYIIDNFGYQGVFFALGIYPLVIAAVVAAVVPESPIRSAQASTGWEVCS